MVGKSYFTGAPCCCRRHLLEPAVHPPILPVRCHSSFHPSIVLPSTIIADHPIVLFDLALERCEVLGMSWLVSDLESIEGDEEVDTL